MSGNSIVVACLNKHPNAQTLGWAELYNMVLWVRYIPGRNNVVVVQLSCEDQFVLTEWSLQLRIFNVCHQCGKLMVSVFTTSWN